MIILHTADWHLGHRLHGVSREYEHARFLEWLIAVIVDHQVDALLIAGDLFDTANPSASSQELWFRFLADARQAAPGLDIVAIGGNHDSAARLDAPNPLLRGLNVRVVGGLPLRDGKLDIERVVTPLTDRDGRPAAWAVAVPFLRPADLPLVSSGDGLVEGVRAIYDQALVGAADLIGEDQALIVMGHCYMTGSKLSELSERKILGGNQHALPLSIFTGAPAYVALGHLHLAQDLGRDSARYSGSPIPLSLAERDYRHEVVRVELDGPRFVSATPLPVPRAVEMKRVPGEDSLPLDPLLEALAALEPRPAAPPGVPAPFLEVAVTLDQPEPNLRQAVEDAIADRGYHLARICPFYTGHGQDLDGRTPAAGLDQLLVEEVFRQRWQQDHEGDPPPALLEAFHELLDAVHQEVE